LADITKGTDFGGIMTGTEGNFVIITVGMNVTRENTMMTTTITNNKMDNR
jgi:hypothetical protein